MVETAAVDGVAWVAWQDASLVWVQVPVLVDTISVDVLLLRVSVSVGVLASVGHADLQESGGEDAQRALWIVSAWLVWGEVVCGVVVPGEVVRAELADEPVDDDDPHGTASSRGKASSSRAAASSCPTASASPNEQSATAHTGRP